MTDIESTRMKVHTVPASQLGDLKMTIEGMIKALRDINGELDARMIETIRETERPIPAGECYYTLVNPRKVKCRNIGGVFTMLLDMLGGDIGQVADCMASEPWKQGAIHKLMAANGRADEFDDLFLVTYDDELKLTKIDPKFIK